MEWVFAHYEESFIGHGFLAVDFFFCLSGFVIGYAYDDRIKAIGIKKFFKQRLIRLHPLVVLGSVLGLATFLFDPFGGHPETYSAGKVLLIFLSSVLLIPYAVMPDRFFNNFGLNAPAWSLFWEYIINIVYALVLSRISLRVLRFLTLLAALGICWVARRAGTLVGGWDGNSFWDGACRVAYSFLAGLLVYRSRWMIKTKLNFLHLSILLVLTFIMPFSKTWNWLTEPLVILFYFPLLVALGAGAMETPRIRRLCIFAGNLSYPLYMTHYAAIWMFGNYFTLHKPAGPQLVLEVTGSILILLGIAYLAMSWYDIPVRRYLTRSRAGLVQDS